MMRDWLWVRWTLREICSKPLHPVVKLESQQLALAWANAPPEVQQAIVAELEKDLGAIHATRP